MRHTLSLLPVERRDPDGLLPTRRRPTRRRRGFAVPPQPPASRPGRPAPCRRSGRSRAGKLLAALALPLALLTAACGEDGSLDVAPPPSALVALSPAADTVSAGEVVDPPISVRLENSVGDPIEGIPVRFLLASGEGRVFPQLAVSKSDGIAEADFEAPTSPGEARVRVDVPSASDVPALHFDLVTEPAASVSLAAVEGADQVAELDSQLPLAFRVEARTASGAPAGGVPVAWSLEEGAPEGARLSRDTTFTDAEGTARTLLTLGGAPGLHRVRVHAVYGVASDTVAFTAEGRTALGGDVQLDSVRPLPMVAGEPARAFGTGFPAQPSALEVRVEGELAEVLDAAPGEVRFLVPSFDGRCLPAREVGVRLLAQGEPSNGDMLPLRPARPPLELGVGSATTLEGPSEVSCLQLAAAEEAREYQVAVQSAVASPGASTTLRLRTVAGTDAGSSPRFAVSANLEAEPEAVRAAERAVTPELALRSAARRELSRRRATPVRRAAGEATGPDLAVAPSTAGDTLEVRFAVDTDFSASCADTTRRIRGVVRGAGENVLLVEDLSAAPGGFGAEEWSRLTTDLDRVVYPADTAYFGAPADIDGNGRVLVLFTPEVNRLNPPGAVTGIGGFFLALDLAASGRGGGGRPGPGGEVCPASNEAEILYLLTPDPEGAHGDPVSVARARRNALGIVAHELQHLISAERRVLGSEAGFEALEETWLDEGLSHVAEEVAGLAMIGLAPGGNYAFGDVAGTREALDLFNAFHINNFFQLGLYMLEPARATTLAPADPGGPEGLQMRGFAWGLLRWTGDQAGGDERAFFRDLAGGGQRRVRGVVNLERVAGRPWPSLVAGFAAALAADDSGVEGLASRLRVTTWDLRDVFASLNRNAGSSERFPVPFPLAVTPLQPETTALEFDVAPSATRYFSLALAPGSPSLAVGVGMPTGAALPEASRPQITVVRTR